MDNTPNIDAKERILTAAIKLFSEKGYDASRVNEIANAANVNKALIYYYFKNKEDILDQLVYSLLENAASIVMDFIHENIVNMIKDSKLDILPDRLRFADEAAVEHFLDNAQLYYEKVLDYFIENRSILRILTFESLKYSKHHNLLFSLLDFIRNDESPFYKTISAADEDFNYSEDMALFEFFYSVIPLVSFAVYYDDYRETSKQSAAKLRLSFLRSFRLIFGSLVTGNDILIKKTNSDL